MTYKGVDKCYRKLRGVAHVALAFYILILLICPYLVHLFEDLEFSPFFCYPLFVKRFSEMNMGWGIRS